MSTETVTVAVPVPPRVAVRQDGGRLVVEGPLGRVERRFPVGALSLEIRGAEAVLTLTLPPRRRASRALLRTWEAHLRNLVGGVTRGVEAKMKVVAAHFPMKVAVKGETLLIENFLGEKHPRSAPLLPGTRAQVEGEFVILNGNDIEQIGQSAANIERATRIREYDPRVFQDGIYLIERAHLKEAAA
ncbi:MAG: 50S ribosomal protein L6 [Thermoplasmata archaeon]